MRYIADHDFHIHSTISPCCHDPNQTPQAIYEYAKRNNYRKICLTNHLWDETVESVAQWHEKQRFEFLTSALPLPNDGSVKFCFGAETDMDMNYVVGISKERIDEFDFIVVPTTHLHLSGYTIERGVDTIQGRVDAWINRFRELLKKDLPFYKMGIAHLTCGHIFGDRTPEVIANIPDDVLYELFTESAEKGLGIELNIKSLNLNDELKNIIFRPYYIAKDCGCKFYLGSDSHKVKALDEAKDNFENIITILDLQESDKFDFFNG